MGCCVVLLGRWPQTTENSPLPRCTPQPLADSLPMPKTLLAHVLHTPDERVETETAKNPAPTN